MKILFLQDKGVNESLGVCDISAVLKKGGHSCLLLIEREEKDLIKEIKKYSPDLIAFSCMSNTASWVVKTARKLKRYFNVPIVVGGPHVTYFPSVINEEGVDIVCIGEGEYAMLELADKLKRGEDITKIKNLWVKKDSKIYKNEVRNLIGDLDELPFPDRSIYYDRYVFLRNVSMKRFMAFRGCPFSCTFCFNHKFNTLYKNKGKCVRKKSARRMAEEIKDVRKKYPLKTLHFSDDTFCIDKKWVMDFFTIYKKEIGIPFTCNIKTSLMDEEMVKKLKEAGCFGVGFGLESGNEKYRNEILKKSLKDEDIIRCASYLKKYKIKFNTFNMIALPGETIDMAFETIYLNNKIKSDFVRIGFLVPFPELEITKYAIEKGYLPEDYADKHADYTGVYEKPVFKSKYNKLFSNLLCFFPTAVKHPHLIPLIKVLIKLPLNFLYRRMIPLWALSEKKFYGVSWYWGIRYFFHANLFTAAKTEKLHD